MHAEHARSIDRTCTHVLYVCQRHFHYQCVYNARDYHFTIDPMHASANIPQNGPGFTKKMLPMRNLKFSTRFVIHNVQLYSSLELRLILNVWNQLQFYMEEHVENFLVIATLSLWNGAHKIPCFRSPIARWICHASIDSVYYCARELPCLQVSIVFILRII